jgi:hypothetical protein
MPEVNALKPGRSDATRGAATMDVAAVREVTGLATALKEAANIAGLRLTGPATPLPGSVAAVGWAAERAAGAVMALPGTAAPNVSDVIARIVQFEQRRCRGEYFFVASGQTHQEGIQARLYVACKMTESTSIAFYLVAPRGGGGVYVLSNTSAQGFAMVLQRETEALDAKLRSGIGAALRRLGQPPSESADEETPRPQSGTGQPASR